MMKKFNVSLSNIIREISLKTAFMPEDPDKILLDSPEVSRLGLELTGFFEFFDNKRILIMGNTEFSFLSRFGPRESKVIIENVFLHHPPAVIVTRGINPFSDFMKMAKKYSIPVLLSSLETSVVLASVISYMRIQLAPRVIRHGVLMEVYGYGIFIVGDSGIGKSETAIELVKRGHRLVADDAVQIRKISDRVLMGSSPKNIRHFIELRGIGMVNVRRLFGMGSVKSKQEVDMVVALEVWDNKKAYDRIGLESEFINILGVEIPHLSIPVKPGRNLSSIIEVAAMNNRQKSMGYNAAKELYESLGMDLNEDKLSRYQTKLDI